MIRKSLYQSDIIEHSQNPRYADVIKKCTHSAEGYNQVCGDYIKVSLNIQDDLIREICCYCECCAVCKSSASIMADVLTGQTIDRFIDFKENFLKLLDGKINTDQVTQLGELKVFTIIHDFPMRKKCATLPWLTLKSAIDGTKEVTTENE